MTKPYVPEPKVTATCADCGFVGEWTNQKAIDAGGRNRDPGEAVCMSCSASRTVLIRRVMALPDTLHQIMALRMKPMASKQRRRKPDRKTA